MKEGGNGDLLYMGNAAEGRPVPAPGCEGNRSDTKLDLGGFEPPIEGRFDVTLKDGKKISVATVGSLVREHLEPWTFEQAAKVTKLDAALIERFAEGFAAAKRPMVLSSWGSNRYFHSDHMNRSKILCLSLKGCLGAEKGAGFHSTGWIGLEGLSEVAFHGNGGSVGERIRTMAGIFGDSHVASLLIDKIARKKSALRVTHDVSRHLSRRENIFTNSASQNYNHQGIKEILAKEQDHLHPRPLDSYVQEAQEKGWTPVCPAPQNKPRAWISGGSNVLRRSNQPQKMLEHLWPDLELVIDVNQKNTFTGLHADYLLPVAGYYEKPGIKYTVAYIPYLHYCDQAVKPVGEAKDEWEIFYLLAQEVERIAKEKNIPVMEGCSTRPIDLQSIGTRFSYNGQYGAKDAEKVTERIISTSENAAHMTLADLKKNGIGKFSNVGSMGIQENLYNPDWKGEGVLQALTEFVRQKWPWPTLTGRQQYYIDHPWFIEAGESLPTHFDSPKAGGDHPFQFVSCHSRWSVHSVWRDTPMLLRLQRGEPVVYLNPKDAEELGIEDGGWAAISNDCGKMRMRLKYSTMVRPRVAYYFHAWEPHQFPDHKSFKWVIPGLMNPMHFAGGEGHTGFFFGHFTPGTHVQDTRVTIDPWSEA